MRTSDGARPAKSSEHPSRISRADNRKNLPL